MTFRQVLFSLAFAFHAGALVIGAIPPLDDFGTDLTTPRAAGPTARSRLTALLDQVAVEAVRAHRLTVALVAPVSPFVLRYLDLAEQSTKWNMFSTPGLHNDYVRFDYVFRGSDGVPVVDSELVFPATPPGRWRLAHAYFDSFTDKAFAAAAEMYLRRAQKADQEGTLRPQAAMDEDVRPLLAYYGSRRRRQAPAGMTLERVEYWRGWASSPAPGTEHPPEVLQARLTHLELLTHPRSDGALAVPAGDITWRQWSSLELTEH